MDAMNIAPGAMDSSELHHTATPVATPLGRGRTPRRAVTRTILALALAAVTGLGAVAHFGGAPLGSPGGSLATATAGGALVAAPNSDENAAVEQVIQRSNAEQAQAIASQDTAVPADTATVDYSQRLQQVNQDLLDHGVANIELVDLEWGPITVDGATATATTYETWTTTYRDGTTEVSRDQNDYTLVQQDGGWKIAADDHPNADPSGGGVSSAGTAPAPRPGLPASPDPSGSDPRDLATSNNWSGYAATGGTYTAVSGTWTVPQFSAASSAGADATWVGIGGVTSRDLLQAGTDQATSGAGRAEYQAWVETLPRAARPVPLAVHPGDSVTVSIGQQTGNTWLIVFTNNTTGQSYQDTEEYASSRSSAEWIEEAPSVARGGVLPLDDFGTVSFTDGSTVQNGQTVSIAGAGAQAINLVGFNRQVLAAPSALSADGAGFSITRTANAAGQPGGVPGSRRRRFGG